jgi:hypothetical protein
MEIAVTEDNHNTDATPEQEGWKQLPPNKPIILRNTTCAYCGKPFDKGRPSTKEHVIGRRFVPRGSFDGQWNLILNACERCNRDKADLEDDISVITMMPDAHGRYAVDDDRLRGEVIRKGVKARSRRTGRAVAHSHEELKIQGSYGPGTIRFDFKMPIQIDESRIFRLANYHFRGFFYFITYQYTEYRGGFVQGKFYPLMSARRTDWGAPRMRWFMDLVRTWTPRVHSIAADEFFKLLIRKQPDGASVWAWAMEWNHGMRIIGFAGEKSAVQTIINKMPEQPLQLLHETDKEWIRFRTETALSDADDDLFSFFAVAQPEKSR